jgi:hypothetical protein
MKIIKISIVIVIILLVMRLCLPYTLQRYTEYKLNQIPDYYAKVDAVKINLYQGSYSLMGVKLIKANNKIKVPFFSADEINFAVEWKALIKRAFVAKVLLNRPALHFVIDPTGQNQQLSIDDQWRTVVQALFPLNFNKINIIDGSVHFQSFTSNPPFDLFFKNLSLEVNNLRSIDKENRNLSSIITASAKTMDGASANLKIAFDPFASQPTFDMEAALDKMNLTDANNFLRHYTKVKVSSGIFSLYVEAAAAKGKINGYAKPMFKNLKIMNPKKNDLNPVEALYQGAVQLVAKVLENPQHKTVATKVLIQGNIDDPQTNLISIIGYLLRHAFLHALLPQVDNTIDMKDVTVHV